MIAPSKPENLPALRALFLATRKAAFHWMDRDSFRESDFDEETNGEYILVAHYGNNIAGFISIWMKDNFIHHLYVDPAFQQKGIGSELLKAALELLDAPVTLKCLVKNEKAILFYRKQGFFEMGTGPSAEGRYILFSSTK
ncbi:GNAT family N-acetyltransferase [Flavihumibacter fluvii]|uniref:GNAT family N-acetyltransferase n=1 Tax=Flavihumibacter fluvii TaxID=2838157 RepID=UPI001BDF10EE|nr:GNAT family N-acetyltransferase [Flavihumibacter fluvii]ULQ52066.1 GNAT family N-acetyltransferase [Flavihumibacter fluvii]